jgi:hypothetical protein
MAALAVALFGCSGKSGDVTGNGGTGGGAGGAAGGAPGVSGRGGASGTGGAGAAGGRGGTVSTGGRGGAGGTAGVAGIGATGGATGAGGGSGTGGGGGAGGGACLPTSAYADMFAIEDAELCAVAIHAGPRPTSIDPTSMTFGRHGGPLFVTPGSSGAVVYHRMTGQPAGTFTETTEIVAAGIPTGAVLGSTAADLGFFGWTAVNYIGPSPSTLGEIIFTNGAGQVAKRYPVNSPLRMGSLAASSDEGRFFHLGLSALGDAQGSRPGMYRADSCGTTAAMPALLPHDPSCPLPVIVRECCYGGVPSGLAFDRAGNGFATMATLGSVQVIGFHRGAIERNQIPATGSALFTLTGDGVALAAMAAPPGIDGIVAFQPIDTKTPRVLDVIGQRYGMTTAINPIGLPTPMLRFAASNTAVGLATDPAGRLWVATPRVDGTLAFVVVALRRDHHAAEGDPGRRRHRHVARLLQRLPRDKQAPVPENLDANDAWVAPRAKSLRQAAYHGGAGRFSVGVEGIEPSTSTV